MLHGKINARVKGNLSFIKSFRQIRRPAVKFGILLTVLLAAVLLYVFDVGCPFLHLFGVPCPGCGITRAWIAFLHFDFVGAFAYNYMFIGVPVLALYLLFDGEPFTRRWMNYFFLALIGAGFLLRFFL